MSEETKPEITIHTCGPSRKECKCQCPDGPCEHKWDGETVSYGRAYTSTCSKCGMLAIEHSLWVGP